jgi:uncharacterized protein with GYD domain
MAYYLLQGAYTAESWTSLLKNPVNRIEAIRPVIEKLGGSLEGGWFAFGDYDVFVVYQMPDDKSAAAFALSIAAGGAFKSARTTPLMSFEDGIEAMRKAGESGYQPPA